MRLLVDLVVAVVGDVLAEALLAAALRRNTVVRRSKPLETVLVKPSSA